MHFSNVAYHPLATNNYSGPLNPDVVMGTGTSNASVEITIHSSGDPVLDAKASKTLVEEHVPGKDSVGINNVAITVHSAK